MPFTLSERHYAICGLFCAREKPTSDIIIDESVLFLSILTIFAPLFVGI